MLECKHQRIAPPKVFIRRMVAHVGVVVSLMLGVLLIGMIGYHGLAGLNWMDSLLNAAMILSGMGQVSLLTNTSAKVFASAYALFSGLVFIAIMGILFTPVMHRVLHKFHMDNE